MLFTRYYSSLYETPVDGIANINYEVPVDANVTSSCSKT